MDDGDLLGVRARGIGVLEVEADLLGKLALVDDDLGL